MPDPKRLATPVKHDRDFARLDFLTNVVPFARPWGRDLLEGGAP